MRVPRSAPIIALLLVCFCGCNSEPEPAPAIDEAYVGALSLELIAELSLEAAVIGTVQHGERVDIIERRRRFAMVRTAAGVEGWTDGRMLLSPEQMARLRRLSMHAAQLPSQGKATVYDTLNVHTAPNRQAPSFYQIREGVLVQVVSHRIQARGSYRPPTDDREVFPQLLYRVAPDTPPPAGGSDDWSLIRIPDGRAGWALTRMLVMAIPDEVAQYAEGAHITSYFSLGEVTDAGDTKHHWLWTTITSRLKPYEFDSFRVFVWSLRRHRYETAHVERRLVGYYPVEAPVVARPAGERPALPRFSLIVREEDGSLSRRTYSFAVYRVRMIEKTPWEAPAEEEPPPPVAAASGDAAEGQTILQEAWRKLNDFWGGS